MNPKIARIESLNSVSDIERYCASNLHACKTVNAAATKLNAAAALQIAVNFFNNFIDTEDLVPTLLVFEALLHLGVSSNSPSLSTSQQRIALPKGTDAVTKHFAKSQVSNAAQTRNGREIWDIHYAPVDDHIFVYQTELDK